MGALCIVAVCVLRVCVIFVLSRHVSRAGRCGLRLRLSAVTGLRILRRSCDGPGLDNFRQETRQLLDRILDSYLTATRQLLDRIARHTTATRQSTDLDINLVLDRPLDRTPPDRGVSPKSRGV